MIQKYLSTLKIHKLTQEQYERELNAGRIDSDAIYLTEDKEQDLSHLATKAELANYAQKTDLESLETTSAAQAKLVEAKAYADGKAPMVHSHDSAYDAKGAANTALENAKTYVGEAIKNFITSSAVDSKISSHNVNTSAHNDIRTLITTLTNRFNALANSDDTTLDQLSEIVAYIKSNKNLIDAVTTNKVNVADIINNLTTNVSNKPLSAAQGVALKGLIDALTQVVNGKADAQHTHSYLPLSGGTLTGDLTVPNINITGTTSKMASHYYHRLYGDNNVYVHYYDTTDFSKTTTATFRVSDATNKTFKALQFSGDGNFKWNNSQVLTEHNYGSYIRTLPYLATTQAFSPAAGKDANLTAGTSRLYANALVISNPTTANDVGWVRVTGTGESDTVLEIATGDDGGGSTCEAIVARQYNTSNAVARQAVLLASNGTSSFPVSVTAPSFIGSLSGNATTATTLQTARTITIGNSSKSFNGSGNLSYSLVDMGIETPAFKSYSSFKTASSGADGWYTLFTMNDSVVGSVICFIKAYAHSSCIFIVSKGYSSNTTLSILDYNSSSNGSYAYVKAIRTLSDGQVQALINKGTVNMTVQIVGGKGSIFPVAELVCDTSSPSVQITRTLEQGKIIAGGFVGSLTGHASTSTSSSYLSVLNTETKNVGRLQFFQNSGNSTLFPNTDWWSLIRMQHAGYTEGYWQEMAYCFHSDDIKYRRNVNGSKTAWKTIAFTDHTHSTYLPLSGGTMGANAAIKFPASAGAISINDPMSITYGRIASYGTLCINGDTDGSTNESVIITAGRGHSSSASDGLSVGYSSLTWQGNSVVTVAGATMAGKITGSTAQGSWISCTRNGAFRLETAATGGSASSVLSMKTSSGAWSITNLTGSNSLFFCFGTDTNYSNGNNTTTNIEFSGGTIIASLSGNASTASKWATARTLTLTGAVTGSASIDGSGNVSLATSANHSHDGAYVNVTGDSMSGRLTLNTSIYTHSSPVEQSLVINSSTTPSGTTLGLANAPGIGFHIANVNWGSLVFDGSFNFINSSFNGYMPVKCSNLTASGTITGTTCSIGSGGLACSGNMSVSGSIASNIWYSSSYGGGWYMSDTTWIRSYAGKSIYQNTGIMRTDGTLQVGADGAYFNSSSSGTNVGGKLSVTYSGVGGVTVEGSGTTTGIQILRTDTQYGLRVGVSSSGAQGLWAVDYNTSSAPAIIYRKPSDASATTYLPDRIVMAGSYGTGNPPNSGTLVNGMIYFKIIS